MAGLGAEGRHKLARRLAAGLAALAVIYFDGVTVLSLVTGTPWPQAWALGAAPFVLVDAGKVLLAASGVSALEGLWALRGGAQGR